MLSMTWLSRATAAFVSWAERLVSLAPPATFWTASITCWTDEQICAHIAERYAKHVALRGWLDSPRQIALRDGAGDVCHSTLVDHHLTQGDCHTADFVLRLHVHALVKVADGQSTSRPCDRTCRG